MKNLIVFLLFYFMFLFSWLGLCFIDFKKKKKDWCDFLENSSILHFGIIIGVISFVLFFISNLKEMGFHLILVAAFIYGFYCLTEILGEVWRNRKRKRI